MQGENLEFLSEREAEILRLASEGYTDSQIATRMGIGTGTVKTYWSRLRGKLSANNRTEAVAKAARLLGIREARAESRTDPRVGWWEALVNVAPLCFAVVDSEGLVISYSQGCLKIREEFVVGRRLTDQVPQWLVSPLRKALANNVASNSLFRAFSQESDGKESVVQGIVSSVLENGVTVARVIVFLVQSPRHSQFQASVYGAPEPEADGVS